MMRLLQQEKDKQKTDKIKIHSLVMRTVKNSQITSLKQICEQIVKRKNQSQADVPPDLKSYLRKLIKLLNEKHNAELIKMPHKVIK
jgi:hypothetical protein